MTKLAIYPKELKNTSHLNASRLSGSPNTQHASKYCSLTQAMFLLAAYMASETMQTLRN